MFSRKSCKHVKFYEIISYWVIYFSAEVKQINIYLEINCFSEFVKIVRQFKDSLYLGQKHFIPDI